MDRTSRAIELLNEGQEVKFERRDGKIQTFKLIDDNLYELKNDKWIERTYIPAWEYLRDGKWIIEEDEDDWKQSFEYDIPIQSKDDCEKYNKSLGTNFKSTEEHMELLFEKIHGAICDVGDAGGWYLHDGIKIKVSVEYDPENK